MENHITLENSSETDVDSEDELCRSENNDSSIQELNSQLFDLNLHNQNHSSDSSQSKKKISNNMNSKKKKRLVKLGSYRNVDESSDSSFYDCSSEGENCSDDSLIQQTKYDPTPKINQKH